ncbi:MAG: hypothetical protein M0026_18325 [Nocardiopsaceae bacterium]|nr:hypothetical protein [Nocardiopsaceae bacterium]
MPTNITYDIRPPTDREALLTHLAAAIRSLGGTALVALDGTAHPVLYVRHQGRTIPVVLIQGITGGWRFLWGRTGWADSSQVEAVAAHLAGADAPAGTEVPPAPSTGADQRNLVTDRRPALRKVA